MESRALEKVTPVVEGNRSIQELKEQADLIHKMMKEEILKVDVHYGILPGTKKPGLYKAGAEKLNFVFRLDPQYEIEEKYEDTPDGRHYSVVSKCLIYHIPTGQRLGSGFGSCTTREKKYAYREAFRKCPICHKPTIYKSKREEGWFCWLKKGGCGVEFQNGDPRIEGQITGIVPNPDLADQYNTILKMANKRSLVAVVLNVTAASDTFTQDIEEEQVQETIDKDKNGKKKPDAQELKKTGDSKPIRYKWQDEMEQDGFGPKDGIVTWFKATAGFADTQEELALLLGEAKKRLTKPEFDEVYPIINTAWKSKKKVTEKKK